jgi:hypothetical protein
MKPKTLPKPAYAEGVKRQLNAYDGHVLRLRLCDEHAIKWIFVSPGSKPARIAWSPDIGNIRNPSASSHQSSACVSSKTSIYF